MARERDIFVEFQKNVQELTKGNITPYKMDCFVYLATLQDKVKFCHIDASHDYASVKQTIRMLIPKLIPGGILCGDDYTTAHMEREDLQGGVQKAVIEMCPGHMFSGQAFFGNFWWWVKP